MFRHTLLRLATATAVFLSPGLAVAQSIYGAQAPQLSVLPGWNQADGTRVVAFRIDLPKGWKTYWRAPGDGGIPPVFHWTASGNLRQLEPQWPTPNVYFLNGLSSVGYVDSLILPIVLTPRRIGTPIRLRGSIDIGICKDVCMPATLTFKAKLSGANSAQNPDILAAMADAPQPAAAAGMRQINCVLTKTAEGLRLSAKLQLPSTGQSEFAVVETANPEIWVAESETQRSGNQLSIQTELMHIEGDSFALDRAGIRITILGSNSAVDIQGCPA